MPSPRVTGGVPARITLQGNNVKATSKKKTVADKMLSLGGNERQITFHYYLFALERGLGIFTLSLGQQFAHLTLSSTENICSDDCVFI